MFAVPKPFTELDETVYCRWAKPVLFAITTSNTIKEIL